MNPSIHHPSWYSSVGAISSDAAQRATEDNELLICTPQASVFQTKEFRVQCLAYNWKIETIMDEPPKEAFDSFLEITHHVFDDCLEHTPVDACGFNFSYHKNSYAQGVGTCLDYVVGNSFESLKGLFGTGKFQLTSMSENPKISVSVAPSTKLAAMVFVDMNFHYASPNIARTPGRYSLTIKPPALPVRIH